jgi:peptidoglycan/LPS O-acetylase OafA/YrhL
VVTLVLGRLIESPIAYQRLATTGLYTALYGSNFHFVALATNYQAGGSHDHPLLHTWSLAVEEQFYLFWPLLVVGGLWLARRTGRSAGLAGLLGVTALASFAASVALTRSIQPFAFFGLPTRAWEFAVGGLAVLLWPEPGAGPVRGTLAWVGLGAVLIAGMTFDESTSFPGTAALLPTIGTVLVLVGSRAGPGRWLGSLLSLGPLQRIGRLSYSWHLWHWPVLVYAAELGATDRLRYRIGWAVVALALAGITFVLGRRPDSEESSPRSQARFGST